MIVGFTGTRIGMSNSQKSELRERLRKMKLEEGDEFHHGDCVGADEQAHKIVRALCPKVRIIIHPPSDDTFRANCKGDVILQPASFLVRNRAIVNSSGLLIAAPAGEEILRSGTWSTVRYARSKDKRVRILER